MTREPADICYCPAEPCICGGTPRTDKLYWCSIHEFGKWSSTAVACPDCMDNLARNLAVAGAMHTAAEISVIEEISEKIASESYGQVAREFEKWQPGCGRLHEWFKP